MDSKEGRDAQEPLERALEDTSRDMATLLDSENGSCAEFVEWN